MSLDDNLAVDKAREEWWRQYLEGSSKPAEKPKPMTRQAYSDLLKSGLDYYAKQRTKS
jgi:hypothetical protein